MVRQIIAAGRQFHADDIPLDWAVLVTRMGSPLLRKTLESLLRHHHHSPAELRRLAAARDMEAVRMLAHRRRGAAGLLAAGPAVRAAESLETGIRCKRMLDLAAVETLAGALESLLAEAEHYLACVSGEAVLQ